MARERRGGGKGCLVNVVYRHLTQQGYSVSCMTILFLNLQITDGKKRRNIQGIKKEEEEESAKHSFLPCPILAFCLVMNKICF